MARKKATRVSNSWQDTQSVSRTLTIRKREDEKIVTAEGDQFSYQLHKLVFDATRSELVGDAGCDPVYICAGKELPQLIAFLQKCIG